MSLNPGMYRTAGAELKGIYDNIKIVKIDLTANLPPTFILNSRGLLGSSLSGQFAFFVYVTDVQADGVRILIKQLGHPQRFSVSLNRLPCRIRPSQVADQEREPPGRSLPCRLEIDVVLVRPFRWRL
jgi:hypothetical protein